MKLLTKFSVVLPLLLMMSLSGCSEGDKTPNTKTPPAPKTPVSHTLLNSAVDSQEKQKFEQAFAAQCVQRELRKSSDPDNDKARFEKPCTCIATYMMKDLTAIEAEKFLVEHENVQSLRIKYDYAAFHCLQEKVPAQEPHFTHNQ